MKSLKSFTVLLLSFIVACSYYKANADENQAMANANQTLMNANQTLTNANQILVSANQMAINNNLNNMKASSTNPETPAFKASEWKGFVGATLSTSGFVGVKAALEFYKNFNQYNSLFVGLEGTYYIPNIKNKFYEDSVENINNQIDLMHNANSSTMFNNDFINDIKHSSFAVSEKYQASFVLGTRLKFFNYFALSPYVVFSIGYGKMMGIVGYGSETRNVHSINYVQPNYLNDDCLVSISISDYLENLDNDNYLVFNLDNDYLDGYSENYFGYQNDYLINSYNDGSQTSNSSDIVFSTKAEEKNKFFYKGGLGLRFTIGDRIFVDARYQISPVNIVNFETSDVSTYKYEYSENNILVDSGVYSNLNNNTLKPTNRLIHEVSLTAGIYLF